MEPHKKKSGSLSDRKKDFYGNGTGWILRNYKVSMPKNFRKETAAQMPILAKNPKATASDIKRTPNFNISLAIFFFTDSLSLTICPPI